MRISPSFLPDSVICFLRAVLTWTALTTFISSRIFPRSLRAAVGGAIRDLVCPCAPQGSNEKLVHVAIPDLEELTLGIVITTILTPYESPPGGGLRIGPLRARSGRRP